MSLKAKFRRWLVGTIALIAGGTAVATAILQSAQTEGLTCDDAQTIVTFMENKGIPQVVPFVDLVVPPACNITYTAKCAKMGAGLICRNGMTYGPGVGGGTITDGPNFVFQKTPCNPALGTAIPCNAEDGDRPIHYNPATIDKAGFIQRLAQKLKEEGYLGDLPEE